MKRIVQVGALLLAMQAGNISATEEATGPYISLGQNWFIFDNDRLIEDKDSLYLGFGYQTSDHVGVEFRYSDVGPEYFNVSGIYRLKPRSENSFYWKGGVGRYTGAIDKTNMNLGLGYETHFNKALSLTLGVDSIYQFSDSQLDWVPYVGFNLFFGNSSHQKPQAPVKQAPVDSDNDGVVDNIDQCTNTPTGAKVDATGCELDSDNDGIVDSIDECPQTPTGAKVDAKGCRIMLIKDVSITLNVQFANNSNNVSNEFRSEIKKVADFMLEYPDTNVVIEGHTDSRGAASYNQKLSQKRADAVMNYLISEFNIDKNRVSALGKGETTPIADNNTAEGRASNRRVQAEIKTSVSKAQ